MKLFVIILFSLLISSCSTGNKKQFQKLYYRFPEPQALKLVKPLSIKQPTAIGILANRPIVAINSTGALQQMNYSFWLESPKVLLKDYLLKKFGGTPSSQASDTSSTLESHIIKIEKNQDLAILSINFKLTSPQGQIEFDKTYETQLQAGDLSVSLFVKNIGLMLDQIVAQLYEEIK
jgi:ABC-type uncharacterized transport system auxiliary subunit